MNFTNHTTIVIEHNSYDIVVYGVIFAVLMAILMFGGIKKRGCIYLTLHTFLLKLYTYCCCCCTKHTEKVKTRKVELDNLLNEINNI